MKNAIILCLLIVAPTAARAQLVVWDRSHAPQPWNIYSDVRTQLENWGYTVEIRSTPLMDNSDADIIVILPEDAYTSASTDYTAQEAAWLKTFVDGGKGLLAANCLNSSYWEHIEEVMTVFGITTDYTTFNPMYYSVFEVHPIFDGVSELGDDFGQNGALTASPPSTPVAWNGVDAVMALYESGDGAALWTSHYYLLSDEGLEDYDNLVFLENAFDWLSRSYVANENRTWGAVKQLYR